VAEEPVPRRPAADLNAGTHAEGAVTDRAGHRLLPARLASGPSAAGRLPLPGESRATLVRSWGAESTAALEREVVRALASVRKTPLEMVRKAERHALVVAKALARALSCLHMTPVPPDLWPSLERLIEDLECSSRADRSRAAQRAQGVWERRTVEAAFLRILRERGIADTGAAAARALAIVLRAALGVRIDEADPANERAALLKARRDVDAATDEHSTMKRLLRDRGVRVRARGRSFESYQRSIRQRLRRDVKPTSRMSD
jgi:hypothetical protein